MRVLLAGFGPFPGVPFNPSAFLVKALARRRRPAFADIDRSVHVFAVTYAAVDRDLPKLFGQRPDIILMFGLAGRRRKLCIETRARNAVTVLFPDADGYRPQRPGIAPAKPAFLRGRAPFAELLGAVRPVGFPARLSCDAGRYLCNYAYWRALERAGRTGALVQFVHIPRVRLQSRIKRDGERRQLSFPALVNAAERLLVGLMAARRR